MFNLCFHIKGLDLETQLEQIKASIETIGKASVAQQSDSTEYFWDRFNAVIKFALLNQTEIIKEFGFNITQKVIDCPSNLNWTNLPQNVQQLLLNQQENLFYLNFAQLGWVDSNNMLAYSTLYSLVSKQGTVLLPSILESAASLRFDLNIDLVKLKYILLNTLQPYHHQIRPYHHLMQSFDKINKGVYQSYFNIVDQFFLNFFRYFKNYFMQSFEVNSFGLRKETAASVFSQAILRIQMFLKSNNIIF